MKFIPKIILLGFLMIASKNILGQVVINELYIMPDGVSSTAPNGLIYVNSKEYIELYNKSCFPVNLKGWFLAMRSGFGPQGGVIRIPDTATAIIPPGGHRVIGSKQPAGFTNGNIDIYLSPSSNYCVIGGGLRLINIDGWIALYDPNGVPQDMVYWSTNPTNITNSTYANDFSHTNANFCLPSSATSPPSTPIVGATQIYNQYATTKPSIINYVAASSDPTSAGQVIIAYRQTDGSSSWKSITSYTTDAALGATINKSVAGGNCNGGICQPLANCCPTITNPNTISPLCQGADLPSLQVTTTATGTNAIKFVYFLTKQTDSLAIYGGTNTLGTATPNGSGLASYVGGALGTAGSLPNTPATYYVYAILNPTPTDVTCRPFKEIVVVVNGLPAAPSVTGGSRCGSGTVNLSATPGSGEVIDWYAAATGGTPLQSASSTYTTPNISTTTTYYVESINSTTGCVSATRTAVTATINTLPAAPGVTGGSRCGSGTVSLSATPGSGEVIDWYAAPTGGAPLQSASPTYTTPNISTTTT
ncbi:MAG: lamin tail domain-containing protein, partial [Bacteroidota bacterium]